jgi:AraC family transcriptional regulator
MPAATVLVDTPSLKVVDYRCAAGPHDAPFPEQHVSSCLAFVRRGSFGYRVRGRRHELVAGAVLVGQRGDEFTCSHEHHHGGDECLSFDFAPELAERFGRLFELGSAPPLSEVGILGAIAQAAAHERSSLGLGEAALLLAQKLAEALSGRTERPLRVTHVERRRAVDAALWLEAHAGGCPSLDDVAGHAGLSPFHFLRLFTKVVGVSPHQYLVRTRLRKAAQLLAHGERPITEIAAEVGFADLSNFVRTFRRAAGISPREFRRKILQVRA